MYQVPDKQDKQVMMQDTTDHKQEQIHEFKTRSSEYKRDELTDY